MGGSCRGLQARGQLISGWGAQERILVALAGGWIMIWESLCPLSWVRDLDTGNIDLAFVALFSGWSLVGIDTW